MIDFSPDDIRGFSSKWRNYYQNNDALGNACMRFAYGSQWDPRVKKDRALRGEMSMTINLTANFLMRVQGEAEKLNLSLQIDGKNIDPQLLKEGRAVLDLLILSNDNLSAFSKAINQVYEFGYSAIMITTKQVKPGSPSKLPQLLVIDDLERVFFDVNCKDDFKTQGRYCGVCYSMSEDVVKGKRDYPKEDDTFIEVIDFWYREPHRETWYLSKTGKWTKNEEDEYLAKQEIIEHKVKYMRVANDEIIVKPVDYYTNSLLPIVYWKGNEKMIKIDGTSEAQTIPYIHQLIDAQNFLNLAGSAISGRLSKLGGSKVIVSRDQIKGEEQAWKRYNSTSGVLHVSESSDGVLSNPIFAPADQVDPALLNTLPMSVELMSNLAGITPAQSGAQEANTTTSGLHRQIMQGDVLQNIIKSNHIRAINEVGRVLKEMLPEVLIEDLEIGNGLRINQKEKDHVPSDPRIRNDISRLCNEVTFSIVIGPSSDAERAVNLQAIKELMSVNQNTTPYLLDELAENLTCYNRDQLKRVIEATMPPLISEVRSGELSVKEYRKIMEEKQQEEQSKPTKDQEKMELEKQKFQWEQQAKQQELSLKAQKTGNQKEKDIASFQLKSAALNQKDRAINSQNKKAPDSKND